MITNAQSTQTTTKTPEEIRALISQLCPRNQEIVLSIIDSILEMEHVETQIS